MTSNRCLFLAALLAPLVGRGPGRAADCNGNGAVDAADIRAGRSADRNGNGLPDECETAPLEFGSPSSLELSLSPRGFLVEDFTGDHLPDIACVASRDAVEGPAVALFAGRRGRELEEAPQPAGPSVARLAAGDLDGDGDLDIAAIDSSALWAIRNDGAGGFSRAAKLLGADGLAGLAVERLDGDAAADIAVTRRPDDVVLVLRGRVGGGVEQPVARPAGASPGAILLLDLDGDRDLDAAVAGQQEAGVQLLANDGSGALSQGARLAADGFRAELLEAGDWNGDGLEDLSLASRFALVTLVSAGGGAFRDPAPFSLPRDGPPLRCLLAGDADADGDLDIGAGLASPPGLLFLQNRGDGLFNASARLGLGAPPSRAVLRDLDGDGGDDLVVSQLGVAGLTLFWSGEGDRASAGPSPRRPAVTLAPETVHVGFEPHSCALEDLDGDGSLDMALIDGETDVKILRNDGTGGLTLERSYAVRNSLEMISLAAADLDRDGDIDIATADEYTNNVLVLLNQGRGTFRQTGSYHSGERPTHLAPGDLDGDGLLDLVCTNNQQGTLSVFIGSGGGSFRGARPVDAGSQPFSTAVGDLDGDGDLDLAVAGYGASEVLVLAGDGKGGFARPRRQAVRWPTWVSAADFDADGKLDLAAASYGARQVAILRNRGGGSFAAAAPLAVGAPPFTLIHPDLNGDQLPDIVTSNTMAGTITVFLNLGGGAFSKSMPFPVGADPRFAVAGDIDRDGDVDVISANHSSLDLTVLVNQTARAETPAPYLKMIATEADFHRVSIRSPGGAQGAGAGGGARGGAAVRETKFVVPADPRDASLLSPVFQDVKVEPLHQQFLAQTFPDRFPALSADAYDALTGRRASRRYWSGILHRLRAPDGIAYGYSLLADFSDDPHELPTPAEVRLVHETLSGAFALRPLVYWPDAGLARDDAATWRDTGFPVHVERREAKGAYRAYTHGIGYGRVRVLAQAAFRELNDRGGLSFQDLLVLERAPRDIEGVVAGVVTAEPQGELSHLALRTARRGTPNAYLEGALAAFAGLDGKLVRFEVGEDAHSAAEAPPEEARAWWEAHRPRLPPLPAADPDYGALDALLEMDLSAAASPESRHGGKAANLARLARLLDGPLERYRERGFSIPVRHYLEFLRSSWVPSARDPLREVPCEEFLAEIAGWQGFQSDSRLRFEVLQRFRESLESSGEVDPDLVARVARRIRQVFGSVETAVRFRSSSNVEDALEFNGAGLYESTSACAADDLDGDEEGPSVCDPSKPVERGIERALRRVWASLWSFRAYEERAYYGIPQESAAMGILVSTAFPDEQANGVALTGNPVDPADSRFVVTVQPREESVVSPEPGVLAERDLLEVSDGAVLGVVRAQASSLAPPGEAVLSGPQLEELGALLGRIERDFPVDLGGRDRRDVLLDVEFKFDGSGCLAVKQVRPFLRQGAAPAAPVVTLVIPDGAEACGVFVPSRAPRRSHELKAALRFAAGRFQLALSEEPRAVTLVEELRVGPERRLAEPRGPGSLEARRAPRESSREGAEDTFRVRYSQAFLVPGGSAERELELELLLDVDARAGQPPVFLDEETLTRRLSLEGRMDLVVTFSSCSYELLPAWEIDLELAGGGRARLLERHDPPRTLNETGPAALVRADLEIGGERREVDDYWSLVYTALRHNRAVRYWVLLDPPLPVPGEAQPAEPAESALSVEAAPSARSAQAAQVARVLEVIAPEPKLGVEAEARLLDGDFQAISALRVLSFRRRPAEPCATARPRRSPCGGAESSGEVSAVDVARLVSFLFLCEPEPQSPSAADSDGDGLLTPADAALLALEAFR